MDNQELKDKREATIRRTQDETTWGGPAGDILTGIRNTENAPAERAIWELVQNARDVSWEDEPAIITFVRTAEGLRFTHYGKPFTSTSLESLIKQTSSKVRNDIKTVGKYGTGFLVTHRFGRIIHLSGLLQVLDDQELYYSFPDLKIDRSSDDKVLLKEKLKAQADEVYSWGYEERELTTDPHGQTVFRYIAQNTVEINSLKEAFENAPNQAPYVLALNSQYIQEIDFEDELNDIHGKWRLGETVHYAIEEGETYVLRRTDIIEEGKEQPNSIFLLTSKTTDERIDDSIVTVILPIRLMADGNYQAETFMQNLSKLYLSLPLIGTENWGVNYIVHSPLFECENDSRSGLRIVPQGYGLQDNENRKMLDCAYSMVEEWLNRSLNRLVDRKHLGRVGYDLTTKNMATANYHAELQSQWSALFEDMAIAQNDQSVYITPKELFVVDSVLAAYLENDAILREAVYSVLATAHPGKVPAKEDLLYWSFTIAEWNRENLKTHILGIERIVEEVEKLPIADCEPSGRNEWIGKIRSIVRYVVETKNEALLGHRIIPNEAGELHDVSSLMVPDEFTPGFRSIIDDIVPQEKERFVHPSFRYIGIAGLGNYTEKEAKTAITARLKDLQEVVAGKLKAIEIDVKADKYDPCDNKWTEVIEDCILNAVFKLFTMWIERTGDNMESKLHKLFSEYLGFTTFSEESIGKENFTDCEQMWRTILFEIVYRFELLTNEEQTEKKEWLKDLVAVLSKYSATEDYLERFMLFPDQQGKMRYADNLNYGVGIDKELMEYYDTIVSREGFSVKGLLVDDEFAEYLPHNNVWSNSTVADKIEDEVCNVDGYPNLGSYAKKSDVLQIVKRFRKDTEEGERWMSYFKRLPVQKSTILVSIAESDSVFNLLLQPEKRLQAMSELASNEHCDEILKIAQNALEQKMYDEADMQYKRDLGLYVERYLVEQLQAFLQDGETIKALPSDDESLAGEDIQGGQDIIVFIKQDGGKRVPIYFIEIKSRWSTRESVEMSKLQLETSAREQKQYALCVVDMHDYDKGKVFRKEYPKEFSEIKHRIQAVISIGERNATLVPYINENSVDVHLGGDIKSVVPQVYVKDESMTFDELMEVLVGKIKEYYAARK